MSYAIPMTGIIWGLGQFVGRAGVEGGLGWGFVGIQGGGWVVQEIESPDFRSPKVGISAIVPPNISLFLTVSNILADLHTIKEFLTSRVFHRFMLGVTTTVDKLVLELPTIRLYPEKSTQQ